MRERQELAGQELLGAIDIVEAFTALRHELKLQVRTGRELQQRLGESVPRIESSLASRPNASGSTSVSDEGRRLAEAVAEIDEALERAVETFSLKSLAPRQQSNLLDQFDQAVQSARGSRKSWTEDCLVNCVPSSRNPPARPSNKRMSSTRRAKGSSYCWLASAA